MGKHVFYCVFMLLLCPDAVSTMTINSQTSTDVDSVLGLLLKENEILRNRMERLEAERKQLENRVDMIEESTNQNSELPVRPDGNSDILKLVNGTVTRSLRYDISFPEENKKNNYFELIIRISICNCYDKHAGSTNKTLNVKAVYGSIPYMVVRFYAIHQ